MKGTVHLMAESQALLYNLQSRNIYALFGIILFLLVLKIVSTALYNVYFHPLSKFPGPKLAASTIMVYDSHHLSGNIIPWIARMHDRYGEVVRVGPDRVSYINPQAWKDIYGYRSAHREANPKSTQFIATEANGEYNLLTTRDDVEHARVRKIFTNAFSDKALRLQEPLIKTYVDQLIGNIHKTLNEDPERELNLVSLYNCTTFDVMADLTFGEKLGLLDRSEYSPWVKSIYANVKYLAILPILRKYPITRFLMDHMMPTSLKEARQKHFQYSADRVNRRLERGTDKPDIWNLVLEKGSDILSLQKMHANSSLFMIAGTETTATLLSGLSYLLLTNPDKLKKAVDEVRSLDCEDSLTLENLPRLKYLSACFEEGLRCYPPVPEGLPRDIAKGGNTICGEWVPGNTWVIVPQSVAYHSPLNFKSPHTFIPERWLPGSGYESDRKDVLQPFSYGPRNCLGKNLAYHEMRIILAKMLWHFDLELCPESRDWKKQPSWTLWQKPPLWVKARPVIRD